MVRKAGIGSTIIDEAIGTGDASNKSFSTDKRRVVPGSERIYSGATLLTVTTDYGMDYTRGDIATVAAPGLGVAVTGDYIYLKNLTEQDLNEALSNAERFVNGIIPAMSYQWFQEIDLKDKKEIVLSSVAISDVIRVKINDKELYEVSRENLVENPDLDEGDESTDTIEDWSNNSASGTTFTWSTAYYKTGNRSCKIIKTSATDAYWYSDDFSVEKELPYRLTAWVKTSSVSGGNGAYIRVRWYEGSTEISTSTSSYTTGTADWTKITLDCFAPWNATEARIEFVHDGSAGDAYFDAAFFGKRNWYHDLTNAILYFTDYHRNSVANVLFQRATDNPVAIKLCATVGAIELLMMDNERGGGVKKYTVLDFTIDNSTMLKTRDETIARLIEERDLYIEMLQEPEVGVKIEVLPSEADINARDLEDY